MTREEAKANLEMISVAFVGPVTKEQRKLIDDTFEMAIQALSQEQISLNDINNALGASFRNGVRSAKVEQEGKWIDYQKNGWIYAQCSECGEVHDSPSVYCPSCGAKMVEPQESEE